MQTTIKHHPDWYQIEHFHLDDPKSEYGLATRLAYENIWTAHFTENAILEYKKFMYLAAISDAMVSPSEIVDIVWHKHLLFTKSYHEFCNLLGKRIDHIPSTQSRQGFERFRLAKERTKKLYEENFGEQSGIYWEYTDMFGPLHLEASTIKLPIIVILCFFFSGMLLLPLHYVLKNIYIHIDNPFFIIGYIFLIVISFIGLNSYNRNRLFQIMNGWNKQSFIFNLSPHEVIFSKKGHLAYVIHGLTSQMIEKNTISIVEDNKLATGDYSKITDSKEYSIVETISKNKGIGYATLLRQLMNKPAFSNISQTIHAFTKHFRQSKLFTKLFAVNISVLSILFLLGFVRYMTGVERNKPTTIISLTLFVYAVAIVLHLIMLMTVISSEIIPGFYKKEIIPAIPGTGKFRWNYFLLGNSALVASFIPLVNYTDQNQTTGSGSCGTAGDSGCGSSCSSCGGCGGGD